MRIACSKSDLLKSVNIAMRAVPVHSTAPILECVLIHAEGKEISFTTNDLELGIRTVLNGDVQEPGTIAIDARMFSEIIRKLPEENVTIITDENLVATILCGKAKFSISGKTGEDFTALPQIEKEDFVSVSQFTLKQIILQTIFSISQGDNNKLMGGELFQISGTTLKVVSLDGHRISIRKVELKEAYGDKKVIVPGKTLIEISKILAGETEDMVNIFFMQNHIVFELPGTTIVSRLIEGEYFKIDQMLSSDYETKIHVNRQILLECIDRATLFVREGDKRPIIMNIQDGFMKLNIDSALGSMDEDIDIDKEGKDIMIGFNPKFMIDALKAIEDENVTLYFMNPKAPCIIRNEEQSYIYLILPVNFTR
jgi:DNA polymerase-3 subunit beta